MALQMNPEQAETIALQALVWILEDEDMTLRFLGTSGADLQALRQGADHPEVLCSVMDFVLMDDQTVLNFAETVKMPPENVPLARYSLPGGEQVHWT